MTGRRTFVRILSQILDAMWFWSVLGQKTTFLSIWGLTWKIKGFGQKSQYLEVAEISAISQKFLFFHIQNKIPNIFHDHHFCISHPHQGNLLWWGGGPLTSCPMRCHLSKSLHMQYKDGNIRLAHINTSYSEFFGEFNGGNYILILHTCVYPPCSPSKKKKTF